jgi:hypothetical protein
LHRLPAEASRGATQYCAPGTTPALPSWLDDDVRDGLMAVAAESATGCTVFADDERTTLVLPAFAIEAAADFDVMRTAPLVELLGRERLIGVLLLRYGGFSVGLLRGENVEDSKTGGRFVKNRHRKGGQSQRRFERTREKQVRELFDQACEAAHTKLGPHERTLERVYLGGDRHTLLAFRKRCDYFERFSERLVDGVLPVAGDPKRESLDAAAREIYASDVIVVRRVDDQPRRPFA